MLPNVLNIGLLGYIVIASAGNVETIAGGIVIYAVYVYIHAILLQISTYHFDCQWLHVRFSVLFFC